MKVMRDWQELILPRSTAYVLRTDGGLVIASAARATPGSVLWVWNSALDDAAAEGFVVAVEPGDAQDLVEDALVRAGICRYRSYT